MKLFFEDKLKNKNLSAVLRRAGYHLAAPHGGRASPGGAGRELEFYRPVGGSQFPRFHLYIKEAENGWDLNLHLDQKRPSYSGTSAHAGEYDGAVVENEGKRLQTVLG